MKTHLDFKFNHIDLILKKLTPADPDNLVIGAFLKNQVIGVGVCTIITDLDFYLPFGSQIKENLAGKKIGQFSTLCVREEYQGKGIGQKISQLRLQWAKEKNCDVIVGASWVSGLAHTSNRVFEKYGFKAGATVQNFFREHSLKSPFECPGCFVHPCICATTMYQINLKS